MTDRQEYMDKRWIALALLCIAQFVVVLDASITNVALPTIGESLGISQDNLSWVVSAYVLTFGGFLLLGRSPRRPARTPPGLHRRPDPVRGRVPGRRLRRIRGHADRGAGGPGPGRRAALARRRSRSSPRPSPTAPSATRRSGVWGAVAGSGGAAGVLLGGILTEYAGWEWVLWVNVPIGIGAALLAPRLILESRADSATRTFDIPGALSVTAGLSILVYALVEAPDAGWGSGQTIGLLALAAGLLAAFVAIELRSKAPLMPFSIFRNRTLTGANVVGILTGASLFSMFFFISLYMQNVLGFSAIEAGLAYLPLAVSIIISAGIASQLVTKVGFKPILALGMLFVSAGLLWFSQISAGGSFVADVLGPSLLAAVGLGFAFVPQTIAAMSGVADREAGLASGLINTSQQIGGALGLAVLSSVAFSTIGDLAAHGPDRPRGAHRGLRGRVHGRRRDRAAGRDRHAVPDPRPRQQGAHGDRAATVRPEPVEA